MSVLDLTMDRHLDLPGQKAAHKTLDPSGRVENVLLEVPLLRVAHIYEGVLHAEDQRANIDDPVHSAEEHVCLHVLVGLLAHQLTSYVLLDHQRRIMQPVRLLQLLLSQLLAEERLADSYACRELPLILLHELLDATQIEAFDNLGVDHPELVHLHAPHLRSTVSLRLHLA